jgi:hypothetical protein
MAQVRVVGDELVVALTPLEKLAALHGDVRLLMTDLASVEVVADGTAAVHGLRAPGTAWPGGPRIGTWRRRDGRMFAVARHGRGAVLMRLAGGGIGRTGFTELVVTVADPAAVAAALSAPR